MLGIEQFLGFLLAAMAITASPGPDNLMVLSVGMSAGRRQGVAFGLGCALGCLSHTLLAVLGVSALVAASPWAFLLLKGVGGCYLFWMGWQALRASVGPAAVAAGGDPARLGLERSWRRHFLRGLAANAVNPKVILFFLSFLPQFVVPSQGAVAWQTAQLGVVFTLQAAVLFGLLGWWAGRIGTWLNRRPQAGRWLDRLAGVTFIGLGVRLVIAR